MEGESDEFVCDDEFYIFFKLVVFLAFGSEGLGCFKSRNAT